MVKNLPANVGDLKDAVSIPGSEDPLEKVMVTHPSILAWKIPWTEEPCIGVHRVTKSQTLSDLACMHYWSLDTADSLSVTLLLE